MDRKFHILVQLTYNGICLSTITYDTLVRAGIATTSAFVLKEGVPSESTPLPCAKGSRGIRIMPDVVFDHSKSGPVEQCTTPVYYSHV